MVELPHLLPDHVGVDVDAGGHDLALLDGRHLGHLSQGQDVVPVVPQSLELGDHVVVQLAHVTRKMNWLELKSTKNHEKSSYPLQTTSVAA